MLFRLTLILISVGLVALTVTQVMWPALTNQPFFPILRGESRLEKAERRRAAAAAKKKAVEAEAEAIRLDTDAQRIRDEAFSNATGGAPKPKEPPKT